MRKAKSYDFTIFSVDTLKEGIDRFLGLKEGEGAPSCNWSVNKGGEEWGFDTQDEFLAEYRSGFQEASAYLLLGEYEFQYSAGGYGQRSRLRVSAPTRPEVESVFWPFERDATGAKIELPDAAAEQAPSPVIFIGHGRSAAWRDLKDHLVEQHGYRVQAYETGARSGHTIRDILDELLQGSSFALLVLTGEDETEIGEMRARQNVVHELGLFQGKLGFPRAIAVAESGVELFSNMDGVQQIRFAKGEIRQAFGDVLATLRREFGDVR